MNALILEPSEECPEVVLDAKAGRFEFSGKSYPEDAVGVFQPIFKWLNDYQQNPNPTTRVSFKLLYFNTASQKLILDVLSCFEKLAKQGNEVSIDWYYDEEDESMQEAGEDFANLLDVPFYLYEAVLP